jgi:hypothetical protein
MFHKKQNSKDRGSMLFLAMVVMGIMLVLGVGVATLLVRQIRESGVSEKTAVAFYVKETALDGFSDLDTWTDITWSGAEEKLEYKVTENEGEHDVAVRIDDDNYYFFGKEDEGEGSSGEGEGFSVSFQNPQAWADVSMYYQLKDESGGTIGAYTDTMTTSADFPGWTENQIDPTGVGEVRTFFCEGADTSCTTDGLHIIDVDADKIIVSCYVDSFGDNGICNETLSFSVYKNGIVTVYFQNPQAWADVSMYYQLKDESGGTIGAYTDTMTTSADFPGWTENQIDPTGVGEVRTFFCEGADTSCTTNGLHIIDVDVDKIIVSCYVDSFGDNGICNESLIFSVYE